MKIKICLYCKKEFEDKTTNNMGKFCSKFCKIKYHSEGRRKNLNRNKKCCNCGIDYIDNSRAVNRKYCDECIPIIHNLYSLLDAQKHKNRVRSYHKNYYEEHKEKWDKYDTSIWNKEHPDKRREYQSQYMKNKRNTDINFKLRTNLANRLYSVLKGFNKSASTMKLVGCSLDQLKKHLESQFTKGMSWSNYGKWHVDHIVQCCKFDLSKPEEQLKCFNYTNIRPLWAKENQKRPRK